jgi:hypothetical protein
VSVQGAWTYFTFRFPRFSSTSFYDPVNYLGPPATTTSSSSKGGLSLGATIAIAVVCSVVGVGLIGLGVHKYLAVRTAGTAKSNELPPVV